MNLPRLDVDPDGLLEYSVVFTDRSLNHMSAHFVRAMQDLLDVLRDTYAADTVAVVPGGGTYAMEAVARQLATGQRCVVGRNGFFSYRWTQIFEAGGITDRVTVCRARPESDDPQAGWRPAPVEEMVEAVRREQPGLVFLTHVETASGILLPEDYVRTVADAAHEVGAPLVLDCIASGALWVDMRDLGVDVLISAPQKGWSGTPCAGYVMLGDAARQRVLETTSTSFAMNLATWLGISEGYAEGRAGYHATMPTDGLAQNAALMLEASEGDLDTLRAAQLELGRRVRELLSAKGFASVAAEGFQAPSVVVVHADDPTISTGAAFKQVGLQVAAGVPLQCGEPSSWSTVRLGLFGLDKLGDLDGTVSRLEKALTELGR